jgi:hypothetical protein
MQSISRIGERILSTNAPAAIVLSRHSCFNGSIHAPDEILNSRANL